MKLRISSKFSIPTDAVTQTFAILAKRGVGKTYTASVMAEEMLKANLPVVIADPIGVWWGLRSAAAHAGTAALARRRRGSGSPWPGPRPRRHARDATCGGSE